MQNAPETRLNPILFVLLAALVAAGFVACKAETEDAPTQRTESTTVTPEEGEPFAPAEGTAETATPRPGQNIPGLDLGDTTADDTGNILGQPFQGAELAPIVDELAGKLPGDVVSLVVIDTEGLVRTLTPGGNDQVRQALRQDLSQLFIERFGVDPMGAQWMAIAVGQSQWGALITKGEIQPAQGLTATDIAGIKGQQLKDGSAVLLPWEGYSVVTTADWAPKLVQATGGKLAQAPQYAQMKKAVEQADAGSVLAIATMDNDLVRGLVAGLPASVQNLDAIALTSGNQLGLFATGTADEIAALQRDWEGLRSNLVSELDREYQGRAALDFQEALGVIVSRHFVDSLLTAYKPTFQGELASIRIDPGVVTESTTLLVLGGAMSWLQMSGAAAIDVTAEVPEPAVEQPIAVPPTMPTPGTPDNDGLMEDGGVQPAEPLAPVSP